MANLKCVRHNRRVMVIDIGTDGFPIPITVHRNAGKRNESCDSNTLTIDGEYFSPEMVIEFQNDPANSNDWSDSELNSDSELINA